MVVISCDDKATAWKIFFGYRFHRNFAAEVTYMQAGDYAATGTYLGVPISVMGDDRSVGIAALGIWPVSPAFELFGKLGILSTRSELTGTVGGIPGSASETESEAHYGGSPDCGRPHPASASISGSDPDFGFCPAPPVISRSSSTASATASWLK